MTLYYCLRHVMAYSLVNICNIYAMTWDMKLIAFGEHHPSMILHLIKSVQNILFGDFLAGQ